MVGYEKVDFSKIKSRKPDLWRYKELLPVINGDDVISYGEGFTPILKQNIFDVEVLIKLEFLFPSGSYKDRGSTVLISKAKEIGIKEMIEDSSGNAGSSIAMYAASGGVKARIYVPKGTSLAKLTQIRSFGAELVLVDGTRKDVYLAALADVENLNVYYASHVWNPFFFEGTKTFAFEIFEQLNYSVPDTLVMPVGNGTLFIGTYLGFKYLKNNNYIKTMPRFVGVQAQVCCPIYDRLYNRRLTKCEKTIAEGIAIEDPLRVEQIIDIVRETNGDIITVNELEIIDTLRFALNNGFFIEPTSAVVLAALKKIRFSKKEKILVPYTGSGLKTQEEISKIISGHVV